MSSVNKVILIGYLGNDVEVKFLDGGKAVANFSIATSDRWTDKNTGEVKERTEWHRIVTWDKQAELCGKYLGKGRQVCIEGRLQTRKWKDQAGADRSTTEIVADEVTFLGKGEKSSTEGERAAA